MAIFGTMEKITIKGFGPIKDAEIEVKKLLVLIGEQASGKSTIAKLIYFFKSLGEDVFKSYYSSPNLSYDIVKDLNFKARDKFIDLFGSPRKLKNFEIVYEYASGKTVKVNLSREKRLMTVFSKPITNGLENPRLREIKREILGVRVKIEPERDIIRRVALEGDLHLLISQMAQIIDEVFNTSFTSKLFLVAGRESTVSFQATFESYLENSLYKEVENNKGTRNYLKEATVDETLMLYFVREVQRMREIFRKFGDFDSFLKSSKPPLPRPIIEQLLERSNSILKAKYSVNQSGESLRHSEGSVFLKDSSSGQKESIRIIQDLILMVVESQKVFRVIEEPEAHLFPVAQKELIELLVFLANAQPENQVIITTHSPYVLTTLNNLLFATRVVTKNPATEEEVSKVAPAPFRIDPATFACYSLGNSFEPEQPYCANIVDIEMGMIDQNYLDTVSELLGMEFDHLSNLHARSFKRNAN